jgi:hypothetical protein
MPKRLSGKLDDAEKQLICSQSNTSSSIAPTVDERKEKPMNLSKTILTGLILMMALPVITRPGLAQTASTGALTGVITDPNRI